MAIQLLGLVVACHVQSLLIVLFNVAVELWKLLFSFVNAHEKWKAKVLYGDTDRYVNNYHFISF